MNSIIEYNYNFFKNYPVSTTELNTSIHSHGRRQVDMHITFLNSHLLFLQLTELYDCFWANSQYLFEGPVSLTTVLCETWRPELILPIEQCGFSSYSFFSAHVNVTFSRKFFLAFPPKLNGLVTYSSLL